MSRHFRQHESADADDADVLTGNQLGYEGDYDLNIDFYNESVQPHLDYISKSRIKTFLKCPRKFSFKYLAEERESDNFYMKRGSAVHDAFERFHENLEAYVAANQEIPDQFTELLPPTRDWFQFIDWLGPFFEWELERLGAAREAATTTDEVFDFFLPHSVEEELWIEDPPVGELPWMGPYDALLHAASVPSVDADSGYVVVDYKTGSVPKPEWRDTGIHIDLSFCAWMLEEEGYDVVGAVGMYPTADENVVVEVPRSKSRANIIDAVSTLHDAQATRSDFPVNPQPLCDYCAYQNQCPVSWND